MFHGMSSPSIVTHIFETMSEIQPLSGRVSLVYEQTYCWNTELPCFLFRCVEQAASSALPTVAALYGNAVNIKLTGLSLIGH